MIVVIRFKFFSKGRFYLMYCYNREISDWVFAVPSYEEIERISCSVSIKEVCREWLLRGCIYQILILYCLYIRVIYIYISKYNLSDFEKGLMLI